jgi:hypothetical protein
VFFSIHIFLDEEGGIDKYTVARAHFGGFGDEEEV